MQLLETEIGEISSRIWKTVLGFPLTPCSDPNALIDQKDALAGCIQFMGAWQGALIIYCSSALARRGAAVIYGTDPVNTTREQAVDLMIELTNMTGGNVKSLLPKPCQLSIPFVIMGDGLSFVAPGGKLISEVLLDYKGDPVKILLMQQF
jgi:chemotaxis protein CheX